MPRPFPGILPALPFSCLHTQVTGNRRANPSFRALTGFVYQSTDYKSKHPTKSFDGATISRDIDRQIGSVDDAMVGCNTYYYRPPFSPNVSVSQLRRMMRTARIWLSFKLNAVKMKIGTLSTLACLLAFCLMNGMIGELYGQQSQTTPAIAPAIQMPAQTDPTIPAGAAGQEHISRTSSEIDAAGKLEPRHLDAAGNVIMNGIPLPHPPTAAEIEESKDGK